MVKELREGAIWSVRGAANGQLKMNMISLATGGGVRIGLDDDICDDAERTGLAANRGLVTQILSIAKSMGRTPYTHREARNLLIGSWAS